MTSFDHDEERLKELLNQEGFRLTKQRQKVLDLFVACSVSQHLSAEEVHRRLSLKGENISPSTIYRTLHVMVKLGLLRELELTEGKKYYELSAPHISEHHHLVCVYCGEVIEFEETLRGCLRIHEKYQIKRGAAP